MIEKSFEAALPLNTEMLQARLPLCAQCSDVGEALDENKNIGLVYILITPPPTQLHTLKYNTTQSQSHSLSIRHNIPVSQDG